MRRRAASRSCCWTSVGLPRARASDQRDLRVAEIEALGLGLEVGGGVEFLQGELDRGAGRAGQQGDLVGGEAEALAAVVGLERADRELAEILGGDVACGVAGLEPELLEGRG